MKLKSARVWGYQSFADSGTIEFAEGINLLVGQNNAGKSAFLRAMQPDLADDRHRTSERWEDFRIPKPEVRLDIELTGGEIRDTILQSGPTFFPAPHGENVQYFVNNSLALPRIIIPVLSKPGAIISLSYPGHGLFESGGMSQQLCAFIEPNGGELSISQQYRSEDSTPTIVQNLWRQKMFYFTAERMNVGMSAAEPATRLTANAQNLPSVLSTLNGDRGDVFAKLVQHLRTVFPTIGNVSVRPLTGSTVEIRVWPTEARERVELSFPLLQSGTGVSQVIAILTAVMTVDNAVIMIDEINSFLHPAAVKSLLRILQTEYINHQYIISTHAPEVISFSNPSNIHLVKREGYNSSIRRLELNQVDAFREVADHLGVSMADVFAADRVIWVEGPTEELCFPLLYQLAKQSPLPKGIIFTAVMATGDFVTKRRDREIVYQIYQRLSQVAVPLVVAVAFSFDSEGLSDSDKARMIRESSGAMRFLPRRLIECYLVNGDAIAAFIVERDPQSSAVNSAIVEEKLSELAITAKFLLPEWSGSIYDKHWLAKVDAANLIAKTCEAVSENRVTFNKKNDTLSLLRSIARVRPEQLEELSDYVVGLVDAVS